MLLTLGIVGSMGSGEVRWVLKAPKESKGIHEELRRPLLNL